MLLGLKVNLSTSENTLVCLVLVVLGVVVEFAVLEELAEAVEEEEAGIARSFPFDPKAFRKLEDELERDSLGFSLLVVGMEVDVDEEGVLGLLPVAPIPYLPPLRFNVAGWKLGRVL